MGKYCDQISSKRMHMWNVYLKVGGRFLFCCCCCCIFVFVGVVIHVFDERACACTMKSRPSARAPPSISGFVYIIFLVELEQNGVDQRRGRRREGGAHKRHREWICLFLHREREREGVRIHRNGIFIYSAIVACKYWVWLRNRPLQSRGLSGILCHPTYIYVYTDIYMYIYLFLFPSLSLSLVCCFFILSHLVFI